jgi:hypothetical protein
MADTQTASFDQRFEAVNDPALEEAKKRLMRPVEPQTPVTNPRLAPVGNSASPQFSTVAAPSLNLPPAPRLQDFPKPMPADDRNPLEVFDIFKNPAIVLAGIGSAFTRRGLTTAFNSAAGAVNGYRQGQQQVFEQHKEQWKQQAEQALEQNRIEIEKYKIAWEQRDVRARMAAMWGIASESGDVTMQKMLQAGDIGSAHDLFMKRADIALDAEKAFAVESAKIKARGGMGTDADYIKAIGEYREAPPIGRQAMTPEGREIMRQVHESFPNYDYKVWLGSSAAAKVEGAAEVRANAGTLAALVKQRAAIESFEQNTRAQGRRLLDLAEKVDTTGIKAIESWIRAGGRATGDPDVTAFDTQLQVYKPEVAKILFNPNLTGVVTEGARNEAGEILSGNITHAALKRVVELLEQDFDTRKEYLEKEISKVRSDLHGSSSKTNSASGMSNDELKKALGL